jgi:myo-inositol-1(or 4)-monophosphatase
MSKESFPLPDSLRNSILYEELVFALAVAYEAGIRLLENFGSLDSSQLYFKGKRDLVTDIDREVEQFIQDRLRRDFPNDSILGEELTEQENLSHRTWLVDPLDGTTNYFHGIPFFAVSIALSVENSIQIGVVHLPYMRETFFAVREMGAFLNGTLIQVSGAKRLIESVLATGFPYRREELEENNREYFNRFFFKLRGIRRCGSAAMDLSYVSCGRLDGFWEVHLGPWDVAAGSLIVLEAGGRVTDFQGNEDYIFGKHIVASNGLIHDDILDVLQHD